MTACQTRILLCLDLLPAFSFRGSVRILLHNALSFNCDLETEMLEPPITKPKPGQCKSWDLPLVHSALIRCAYKLFQALERIPFDNTPIALYKFWSRN